MPNCSLPGALPPAIRGSGTSAAGGGQTSYELAGGAYTIRIDGGALALRLCASGPAANASTPSNPGAISVPFGGAPGGAPYACVAFEPLTGGLLWKAGPSGGACPANLTG